MAQICYIWKNANVLWKDGNWYWSLCAGVIPPVPTPSVVIPIDGVDATTLIQPWREAETWNPFRAGETNNKRKQFIQLICRIKGMEYNEEKMKKDFKITADDVKLVMKAVSDIGIKLKK